MRFRVIDKDQLVDLCAELAREDRDHSLASLCEDAERELDDDEGFELVGDLLASASFDD